MVVRGDPQKASSNKTARMDLRLKPNRVTCDDLPLSIFDPGLLLRYTHSLLLAAITMSTPNHDLLYCTYSPQPPFSLRPTNASTASFLWDISLLSFGIIGGVLAGFRDVCKKKRRSEHGYILKAFALGRYPWCMLVTVAAGLLRCAGFSRDFDIRSILTLTTTRTVMAPQTSKSSLT